MTTLRSRTIAGLLWSFTERMGLNVLKLGISILLARLLSPAEFGLIGMLAIFVAVAQSLLDSGFSNALVQRPDADRVDECSVFFFNIGIGLAMATALYLGAPAIARFYEQRQLVGLARLFSLGIVIDSFGLIHATVLTKRIEFKAQMRVGLFATAASGVLAIALALAGLGVWSLGIQLVAEATLRTIGLWIVCSWRPSWIFSLASLRRLFGFGSRLLVAGLLNTFFQNLHQAFIGKVFTATDLGYYSRARSMELAAAGATSHALSRVMFPALSTIQEDPVRLRQVYRKAITLSAFLHLPMMALLIAVARPLFLLLLSERWASSIPYFQLLCVAGLLYPLQVLNLNLLKVAGRSDLFLGLEAIKKLVMVASIAISYRWGIVGLLYGQIVTSAIIYLLNSAYSQRMIGYATVTQIRDVMPFLAVSATAGGLSYLVGQAMDSHLFLQLLVQTAVGAVAYLGIAYALRMPALDEVRSVIGGLLRPSVATNGVQP
jgi:O-antigen/teichoic acid export membrane protein